MYGQRGGAFGVGIYLHLGDVGLGWDVSVIVFRDFGFGFAEVFACCVESGFGHCG